MYDRIRRSKPSRIVEIPIPSDVWDILEDLIMTYGNKEEAIIESIKGHHEQLYGSDSQPKPEQFHEDEYEYVRMPKKTKKHITDGRWEKITENGQKMRMRTNEELEKVDELLEKVKTLFEQKKQETRSQTPITDNDKINELIQKVDNLSKLSDLSSEINSIKYLLRNMGSGEISRRGKRADLSSLEINVSKGIDPSITSPERPLLETALDSILLFDDEDFDEDLEAEKNSERKKKGETDEKDKN